MDALYGLRSSNAEGEMRFDIYVIASNTSDERLFGIFPSKIVL